MIPLRDNIPSRTTPYVTWSLIAVNCLVFYLEISAGGEIGLEKFINLWSVIPKHLFSHPGKYWYTLITAAFLHGGWMHIIGNMVFLYIFGDNVEDRMGHIKYLVFYLFAGALANWAQAAVMPTASIPLIGASGAIAGVLGSYFFYYPHSKVLTLVPILFFVRIIEIPAFLFLGFWFFLQSWSVMREASGGVAFVAHASGFVAGLVLSPFFGDKRSRFK